MKRMVMVTGATAGIGRETAIAFAKNGDNLLLCARRQDKLQALKEDIEKSMAFRWRHLFWMYVTARM